MMSLLHLTPQLEAALFTLFTSKTVNNNDNTTH